MKEKSKCHHSDFLHLNTPCSPHHRRKPPAIKRTAKGRIIMLASFCNIKSSSHTLILSPPERCKPSCSFLQYSSKEVKVHIQLVR